jgi:hypothetical protein
MSIQDEYVFIGQSRIDGYGLFSKKPFSSYDVVSELYGNISLTPNHRSIQIGRDRHFYNRYVDYINHACMPNSYIRVRGDAVQLVALGSIAEDSEEITINYNYSEYSLARPFMCRCCREANIIRGYRYLIQDADEDYVRLLDEYALPYLRNLTMDEFGTPVSSGRGENASTESVITASGSIGKRSIETG